MRAKTLFRFAGDMVRNPRATAELPRWLYDLKLHRQTPLDSEIPWLTYGALHALESLVRADWRILEWGSGGSTIFFARRARHVISIEHDSSWHAAVTARLGELGLSNVDLRLVEPQTSGACESKHPHYRGKCFDAYVSAGASAEGPFDLILVDGRQRNACVAAAMAKLGPKGIVVLDNSDRPYYSKSLRSLAERGFQQARHRGFVPHSEMQSETSIFSLR